MIDQRVPGHGHSIEEMRRRRILIDGSPETGEGLLLQIFTENMVGPIFFEIIQRKGKGFGEGGLRRARQFQGGQLFERRCSSSAR
jgi:4-hydroxyphenylpyruvate dioxygenase